MKSALIVGCGNIGYRHLQALAGLPDISRIHIVETRETQLSEILHGTLRPTTNAELLGYSSVQSWLLENSKVNFAVSAVVAPLQLTVLNALKEASAPEWLILEKPIAQSEDDLNLFSASFPVFVNTPRPLWQGYRKLNARIKSYNRPVHIKIRGGLWGFGCNAVHFLDLFRMLTNATHFFFSEAKLSPSPVANKRGAEYEEFIGSANWSDNSKNTCSLLSDPSLSIGPDVEIFIYSGNGTLLATSHEASGQITWENESWPLESLYVSQSTGKFVEEKTKNVTTSTLPTLEESILSHRALFQALDHSFGKRRFNIT